MPYKGGEEGFTRTTDPARPTRSSAERTHARTGTRAGSRASARARLAHRRRVGTGLSSPAQGPEVELEGESGEDDPDWVVRELRSIVGHRQVSEYETGDGAHEKRLAATGHVLGEPVELGDSLESSYRVAGDEISTVTRTMGGRRFTIVVHERFVVPDGRAVPTSFTVFFWDAETGALTATEAYRDDGRRRRRHLPPGLPAGRARGRSGLSVRELELSEHALLGVAVAP